MNLNCNKKHASLQEQISNIRINIQAFPLNTILNNQSLSYPQQITLPSQKLTQYISHLHLLISKLSQLNHHRQLSQNQLHYDLKTAVKFAQIMRNNLMKPFSPQQFTEDEARQYRVLLNVFDRREEDAKNKVEQKGFYYQSVFDMKVYNQRLQQRIRDIQYKHQQTESIQSLKASNQFLKSQNQFLKKQNQLVQERNKNFLYLKALCEEKQKFIKELQNEIERKKIEMLSLIEQNKQLQEKMYDYKIGDRRQKQKMNAVKDKFFEYFKSKKENYHSSVVE